MSLLRHGCVLASSLVVEVELQAEEGWVLNGMYYFHWEVKSHKKYMGRIDTLKVEYPVLLLPKLNELGVVDEKEVGYYTAINDRWMRQDEDGAFVLY